MKIDYRLVDIRCFINDNTTRADTVEKKLNSTD